MIVRQFYMRFKQATDTCKETKFPGIRVDSMLCKLLFSHTHTIDLRNITTAFNGTIDNIF